MRPPRLATVSAAHSAEAAGAVGLESLPDNGRAWVRDQARKILEGRHRDVRSGIRRRASTIGYSNAERTGADECARYLGNKQDYLD